MTNHLGNVLAVITDNINMDADSTWATIESTQDYMPFGMEMEGRGFNASAMDYGFNGKMKDNSFGSTNYDYGFRIYSPKIGKFLSVDPLTKSYPMLTPYQFASNTPIQAVDLDGLEAYHFHSLGMYTKFTSMIEGKSESEVMAIASNMYYGVNDWINKQDKLHSMEKGWGADSEYNIAITRNDGGPFRVFAPGDNIASIHHATDKLEEIRQGELQKKQAAYEKAVFKMYSGIIADQNEREFNKKVIMGTVAIEGSAISIGFAVGGGAIGVASIIVDGTNIGLTFEDLLNNPITKDWDQEKFTEAKNILSAASLLSKGVDLKKASQPDAVQRVGNAILDIIGIYQNNFEKGNRENEKK